MASHGILIRYVLLTSFLFFNLEAQAVIFGEDDRHEVYEMSENLQELARSVAVKVPADMIPDSGGDYHNGVPLSRNYCSANRYSDQILLPARACTAFLVKPDIVVTAAHCIKLDEDLCGPTSNFRYIFDYRKKSANDRTSYLQFHAEQIYKCKAILQRKFDGFNGIDFAILQLDRPVSGRHPLLMDFNRPVALGDSLFAIGYPTGLPEKITDNGKVLEFKGQEFGSDLDLFSGNSGSPIFDAQTHAVVAINSHGESDWVRNGSCKMAKVCEIGKCHLSYVSAIFNLKDEPTLK